MGCRGRKAGFENKKNGASDRNRTGDNHVGNVMLYQLSYTRTELQSILERVTGIEPATITLAT